MLNKTAKNSLSFTKKIVCSALSLLLIFVFMTSNAQAANTTSASTPTSSALESWTFNYKAYSKADWPNASEPIVNGDYVYIAVNNKLVMLNKSDGKVAKEANLATSIGYTTRPVLTNGLIIVPLNDGRLQANKVNTLETAWTTNVTKTGAQNCSTLTVDGTNVYFGTVNVDYTSNSYTDGYLTCVNTANGKTVWQDVDSDEGYYWDGGAIKGDFFVISGCKGTVKVYNKSTGSLLSQLDLATNVNSDVVINSDGSNVYVMTRDGKLHVLAVDGAGKVTSSQTKDLGLTGCACTPTISGTKLFVGGEIENATSSALAIVDLQNLSVELIKKADDKALLGGGIKGAPLVSTNSSGTYVYFTVNNATTTDFVTYTAGGGVFSYKLGDAQATSIYDATSHHQYCDSPVISDEDGYLYYINDSGTLFKLQQATSQMNRLYNKYTGEHFYTSDNKEKQNLINVGWTLEGTGWTSPTKSNTPVYRLYNPYVTGGDHHYTTSKEERDNCIKVGWNDEGIGWYSDDSKAVPLYRQYNPFAQTGTHNYTADKTENDELLKLGWKEEGIAWYGVK